MKSELYEKLTRIQWLLHKQQIRDHHQQLRDHIGGRVLADATRGQGRILAALQMKDGISTKDLAYLLGLAVSSMNEFLGKLEKNGYIIREPSEKDRRVILVKLTDKGRAETRPEPAADFGDIFDCLSETEQATFGAYLDRVIAALEDKLGVDDAVFERFKAMFQEHERPFGRGFGGFDRSGRGGFDRCFGGFDHGPGGRGRDPRKGGHDDD
ncbi:MAG: MarR family transcriptional regulator [Oscillospiraceae bacterium]|jgi:DNA-binding MarR family transcriptional regulator|nr:MarR family transcriptional regulator [Oscillospiraceae bacterium]